MTRRRRTFLARDARLPALAAAGPAVAADRRGARPLVVTGPTTMAPLVTKIARRFQPTNEGFLAPSP